MILNTDILTPVRTPVTTPIETVLKIGKGTLERVSIDVPNGPNWELFVRLRHMEHTIIPYDDDEWLAVNNNLYVFTPLYNDWRNVRYVTVETCSPQSRYPHTIQVTLEINEIGSTNHLLSRILGMGT